MIKLFTLQIPNDGFAEDELNRFLGSHRILAVQRQFVAVPDGTCLAVVVDYSASNADDGVHGTTQPSRGASQPSVDYRDLLPPAQFALYDKLRVVRKTLADRDKVKPFVVASNAQLAEISKIEAKSLADLEKVPGFGASRIKTYGQALLDTMSAAISGVAPPVTAAEVLLPIEEND